MADYSREQIYDAMRRADAAGDAEAVKALAEALRSGASKEQIMATAAQNNLTVDEAALDANIASRDAGGELGNVLPPEAPTTGQQLAASGQNALAGAAQGVAGIYDFPMEIATGVNRGANALVGLVGEKGLNALGMDGAADWWANAAASRDNALANTSSVTDLIEQASPTPQGMGAPRFAAQLLGGFAVPFGPKSAPRPGAPKPALTANPNASAEATDIIVAGEREGVRVLTSDVRPPKTFIGKIARAGGERIPFAGTGGVRVKQNEERIEAVKNLARDFGVEGSQEIIDEVADDLATTRGAKLTALTNRKNSVIERITAPFTAAPRTVQAINEQVRRLKGIDAQEFAPVIERLQRFGEQLTQGKSLAQVEGQRKLLGDLFADTNLAKIKGDGQKAINAIYGPLRDDMGAFIRSQGGDEAFTAWKSSNDELAAMAGELDAGAFKRVVQDADTTPENVARLLFSKKPSDVRRLYANLSTAGKEKAKAAVLHEAIMKSGGLDEVSPQRFANSLKAFGKTTGIIFGDDAPRIEGVVRLIRATQQASVAAAAPPTGVQNTPVIGAALLTDWLGSAGGATVAATAAGMAARLYESAPIRNLLVGLSKTKPGSRAESKFIERIESVLVSQEGIGANIANDNLPGRLAAEPGSERGGEGQP